ncbi:MAG: hypothetical protein COA99_11985 [Moraxellaceae bacterium]|nr:MAG: hypothetical protein COA99_11985 [Moraxellaceae bacterium]
MESGFGLAMVAGLVLGGSATFLFWGIGRMASISEIVWQAVSNKQSWQLTGEAWQGYFILGLIMGPLISHYAFDIALPATNESGPLIMAVGGLLVGFGTRLSGGCTISHVVCGLGRLSMRSLVATLCFVGAGMVTVFVTRHLLQMT